ncbi:MAG: hypothetical protein EAZ88_26420 [Oscillatoriales cyanobacterium]|nr:MAG: hypothetical protein EAZ88_26420 [Oscillatoriales cyanobacterium]
MPDWGALRFNLHVPNPNGGTLKVSIQGDEPGYENYQPIGNIDLRVADGRVNPGDLAEIPYPIGYADTDTNRIELSLSLSWKGMIQFILMMFSLRALISCLVILL